MTVDTSSAWIYLVDDEFAVRDSMQIFIESTGRKVKTYPSAEAFLKDFDPEIPGCLILDVRMPLMDGLELQEELSKREFNLPIIFISGNAGIPDSAKAFRAGALDFLEKPFDNKVLLERVDEAIIKDIHSKQQQVEKRQIKACLESLTVREFEVLQLIVHSHSNKEVAKVLDVSHRTIETHRANIMEKLQAKDIAALTNLLTKYELIDRIN